VSTPLQSHHFLSSYLLKVFLQIANKNGIKKNLFYRQSQLQSHSAAGKIEIYWILQWPLRESNPQPCGLKHSASTIYATVSEYVLARPRYVHDPTSICTSNVNMPDSILDSSVTRSVWLKAFSQCWIFLNWAPHNLNINYYFSSNRTRAK
jgi:hypothetical protein